MPSRITLSGGTQVEVTAEVDEIRDKMRWGWNGPIELTLMTGSAITVVFAHITSVQAI